MTRVHPVGHASGQIRSALEAVRFIDPEERYSQWLREHAGSVFQVSRAYTWNEVDREDLAQEILLECWKSRHQFRGDAAAATWFYRIALNTALKWKRKRRTEPSEKIRMVEMEFADAKASGIPDDLEHRERITRLHDAVRRLNASDRAIVLLHLDQLPYAEISAVLGISESNVGVRLHRVRDKLRKLMGESNDD